MRRLERMSAGARRGARAGIHASLRGGAANVLVAVSLACVLGPAGAAPARDLTPVHGLTPAHDRITDQAVARDLAALDAMGVRLAAFDTVTVPVAVYTRTQAQAWLALARDQYALDDRSGLPEVAYDHAGALAGLLESGSPALQPPPVAVSGSRHEREDLWQLADSLKKTEALRCVAAELAGLEMTLVRAGHESIRCKPSEPHPYAASATGQAAHLRQLAADCVLPVAIAPATVPAPLPEPAPAPVPSSVVVALKRLGALNNVHFDLNVERISATSATVLDSVAAVMQAVPEIRATLIGHTDPRGSAAYNMALGRRRARAVYDYLIQAGVDSSRLSFASQGKAAPVALGEGVRDYALNRRVEIQYSGPGNLQLDVRHQERDLQIEQARPRTPATKKPRTP